MPYFEPVLRKPYVFVGDINLKNFLFAKMINADYATLKSEAFSSLNEKIETCVEKNYVKN